jgi:hypothetical protein
MGEWRVPGSGDVRPVPVVSVDPVLFDLEEAMG